MMEVLVPVIGEYTDKAPKPETFTEEQRQWAALARCAHFLVFGHVSQLQLQGPKKKKNTFIAKNRKPEEIWNSFVWLLGYERVVGFVNGIRNNPSTQRHTTWPIEQTEFPSGKPGPKYRKQWITDVENQKKLKIATRKYKETDKNRAIPSWRDIIEGEGFTDAFWTFLYDEVDT